jgi:hypothetical protein
MYATSNSNYGGYTKPTKPSYTNPNDYNTSYGQYQQNSNYGFAVQGSNNRSNANYGTPSYNNPSQYPSQAQRPQMTLSPSKNTLPKQSTTTTRPKTNKYW